jgi:precorrin-6Y C5,15-methyltransferase (decarboxylating)
MARIEVVGISLDGADGLSVAVKKLIAKASVLIGSSRHLSYFPDRPATKIVLSNLDRTIEKIYQLLTSDNNIVTLVSGDPLFFSLGRLLLEKFPAEQLSFHPHLSSIQLAFSRLKLPWQDAKVISIHGRNPDELIKLLQQGEAKIAILTDIEHNPSAIALV